MIGLKIRGKDTKIILNNSVFRADNYGFFGIGIPKSKNYLHDFVKIGNFLYFCSVI